jgi:hypothetical protein
MSEEPFAASPVHGEIPGRSDENRPQLAHTDSLSSCILHGHILDRRDAEKTFFRADVT